MRKPGRTRQNQAVGDTAQITDFVQTRHKCWVWGVNDHEKKIRSKYFIPSKFGGPPSKIAISH